MSHKFSTGQSVDYASQFPTAAPQGPYKIVRRLPIENDNRVAYRIKSPAEPFERTAEEHQLSRST